MTRAIRTRAGSPLPLGATAQPEGINFAVYALTDKPVILHLYTPQSREKIASFSLEHTGKIQHIFVEGADPSVLYSYEVEGKGPLLDPYARETDTGIAWDGGRSEYLPLGVTSQSPSYDWEFDQPPHIPREKLIIYEMHVRGFTKDSSSRVAHPGTYKGVIEKIPHLKELGINAVELLPVFEFDEGEYNKLHPGTNMPLCNYWGYSTVNFFCPMNRYATSNEIGSARRELKDLVKALHKNNIEVILDVVYNHTGEGNGRGPTLSFKGFDNPTYYLLDEHGHYLNFSGCGNTFNCNDPVVRELILASLRYWVIEYHVDGFRFDLASILTRGTDGVPLFNPPLVEAITKDPILANVKLIAEAWDAVGLYQVGHFYPQAGRWSEWNGHYRDAVRRFIKGTLGTKGEFATRLCGSHDLYYSRSPTSSVNFITCHDGFSLADLVSYNQKHNYDNGEDNQDGTSWNDSWNCGVEGNTEDPEILALRDRQMRNFHVALMVSQGIPLLNMGDEYGHTKQGNNNTYCQDNELSWFLWDRLKTNAGFFNFYKNLIAFRNAHPQLTRNRFLTDKDIQWHGVKPYKPCWDGQNNFMAFVLFDDQGDLYIAFNASEKEVDVELPPAKNNGYWSYMVNTANRPPYDFYTTPLPITSTTIKLPGYSSVILRSP